MSISVRLPGSPGPHVTRWYKWKEISPQALRVFHWVSAQVQAGKYVFTPSQYSAISSLINPANFSFFVRLETENVSGLPEAKLTGNTFV
ncbi:MAG: hypothetical protein ACLFRE_06415 [Desulfovermiculus sp.]